MLKFLNAHFRESEIVMYYGEEGYLELLKDVLENGSGSDDRTGTGTRKVFGRMIRFDLNKGFPLLTTKRVWFRGILIELLWFISGDTNIRPLVLQGVHIWDEWPFQQYLVEKNLTKRYPKGSTEWHEKLKWFIEKILDDEVFALKHGDLGGQAYGRGWRDFNGVDQLANAIEMIRYTPNSRRIMVVAWNPPEVLRMPQASLPPCHWAYQFQVDGKKLSILVNIRSWDTFLGGPFNIASYAMLLMMVASITDLVPYEVIIVSGDTHIYLNHIEAVETQLARTPRELPSLWVNPNVRTIDEFTTSDFRLEGYNPYPRIKADISV